MSPMDAPSSGTASKSMKPPWLSATKPSAALRSVDSRVGCMVPSAENKIARSTAARLRVSFRSTCMHSAARLR
jgi:hypothetical protein